MPPAMQHGRDFLRWFDDLSLITQSIVAFGVFMLLRGVLLWMKSRRQRRKAETERVYLKTVDKRRYTANDIVNTMRAEGYILFGLNHHTNLWHELDAKDAAKGFGRPGDYKNTWVWYDSWLVRVRAHCQEHAAEYQL